MNKEALRKAVSAVEKQEIAVLNAVDEMYEVIIILRQMADTDKDQELSEEIENKLDIIAHGLKDAHAFFQAMRKHKDPTNCLHLFDAEARAWAKKHENDPPVSTLPEKL